MNEYQSHTAAMPIDSPPLAWSLVGSDDLYRQHSKLIARTARSVFARISSSIPIEDLVQIGAMALITAARLFEDRGVAEFASYAAVRIRGAMIDELRRSATMSRAALRSRREFARAREQLSHALYREPNDSEIAAHLKIAMPEYCVAITAMHSFRYSELDAVYSDHNSWFADLTLNAFENLEHSRLTTDVGEAIRVLPEREDTILQLYYVEEMTLEEIGAVMDISAARVCQLKKTALDKVKKQLGGWH